jgi:hypothetical protein
MTTDNTDTTTANPVDVFRYAAAIVRERLDWTTDATTTSWTLSTTSAPRSQDSQPSSATPASTATAATSRRAPRSEPAWPPNTYGSQTRLLRNLNRFAAIYSAIPVSGRPASTK